jgi:hypothetical protein
MLGPEGAVVATSVTLVRCGRHHGAELAPTGRGGHHVIDNSTRKIAVAIASSAAFVVMGAPTCGSDGRRTAEEVEADVARRHRHAVQEQAELAEIAARVTGAPVGLQVDPPPDFAGEIELDLELTLDGRRLGTRWTPYWSARGGARRLMKPWGGVRIDGVPVASSSVGSIVEGLIQGTSEVYLAPNQRSVELQVRVPGREDEEWVTATVPIPEEPRIDDLIAWRGADGRTRILVFFGPGQQVADGLSLAIRGSSGCERISTDGSLGLGVFTAASTRVGEVGVDATSRTQSRIELPPFRGVALTRTASLELETTVWSAAPTSASRRYPVFVDSPIGLGSLQARAEVSEDGSVELAVWDVALPREAAKVVEGLVPVEFGPGGDVLLCRRAEATSLGSYIWLDLRTLEMAEVEVDRTWKFAGWTEDRAIFSRTIKDSRGEELQESIGLSSPFSDVG